MTPYDEAYYIGRACPESQSYDLGILRPGDMGAAFAYAHGIPDYATVCRLFGIPEDNPRALPTHLTFQQQIAAVRQHATRQPRCVLDVGAGRGELSAAFLYAGVVAVPLEPSPAAWPILQKTLDEWTNTPGFSYLGFSFDRIRTSDYPTSCSDTIIFCESIEHIPEEEFTLGMIFARDQLRKTSGRLIITNWIDYHPIQPDGTGWDHVSLIDDAFYDRLAQMASRTVFRQGSHLVLEF